MKNAYNNKIVASVVALFVVIGLVLITSLFYQTGSIPGLNANVKLKERNLQRAYIEKHTIEGSIVDRSAYNITKASKPGTPALVSHDEAYAYIVGINSPVYGKTGLRKQFKDYLFNGGKDDKGATLQLTLDSALQEFSYELLGKQEGSIIVINANSGEILALASRADKELGFNVNDITKEKYDVYNTHKAFFFNRATMTQDPPGSTFKIVTAASMLANKMDKFVYDDTGELEVNGYKINNYKKKKYGNTDLQAALNNSLNTYFGAAGIELGTRALTNTAEKFMFNKSIELDFCTLNSTFSLKGSNDMKGVSQIAFGQGTLKTSPLHLTMVMQAVVNDGAMLKPFLIDNLTNDGKVVREGKTETLSKVMNKSDAKQLKKLLHNTAECYGFDEENYGYVIAKTGTAETSNKNFLHKYLLMGVEVNGNTYAICIDNANIANSNHSLNQTGAKLLKYLSTYHLNEVKEADVQVETAKDNTNTDLIAVLAGAVIVLLIINIIVDKRKKKNSK